MLLNRTFHTTAISKIVIGFREFLEILKQVVQASFTNLTSTRDKLAKFLAHIAPKSRELYQVGFLLTDERYPLATRKSLPLQITPDLDTRKSKESSVEPLSRKSSLHDPKPKRPKKAALQVTIQLGQPVHSASTKEWTPRTTPRTLLRGSSQSTFTRSLSGRSVGFASTKLKSVQPKTGADLAQAKAVFSEFKARYAALQTENGVHNELISKHREYIGKAKTSMFNQGFVLRLLFNAWKSLRPRRI